MSISVVFLGLVVVLGVIALGLLAKAGRPVSLALVERFAARYAVPVTDNSGPPLVRALAITHRWRRFGLLAGMVLAGLWALRDGRLSLDLAAMFLGWFVGSVVAEWRFNTPIAGTRRRAQLEARTLAAYLNAGARATLWVTLALLAAALVAAAPLLLPEPSGRPTWLLALVQTVIGGVILWRATGRVLTRPALVGDADVARADTALRAHSLAVLVGSAIALAALPLGELIGALGVRFVAPDAAAAAGFVVLILGLICGWNVAHGVPGRAAS